MRKGNINVRALKLLHSFCPSYFPLLVLKSFFNKLSPYFNLYFSAEIINEIVSMHSKERLITLVAVTVLGNFAISIIGGVLNLAFGRRETLLNQREAAYYNQKTLTMDYDNLENTEVRQLRRKITESSRIDNHGRQLLVMGVEGLVNIAVSAVLSLFLGAEMFVLIFAAGFSWYAALFTILIICLMIFSIWYSFAQKNKLSAASQEASQAMIDENRIDDAVDCYNMGKDVRLYRQDKLIMKIKDLSLSLHKKAFRIIALKRYHSNIPLLAADFLLQAVIYMFVCFYTVQGVFGVGSIIKYVGFVSTIINCIKNYFGIMGEIKNNTPFVKDYLDYFDIPQHMNGGRLSMDKDGLNAASGFEVEFKNVSFKYPGSDTFALKNISLKFSAQERLAVVGMNGSGKSTFIKLLCRLYDPSEGEILFNGVNIQEYDYDQYLALFSVIFQDYKLFSFTLGQNVAACAEYDRDKAGYCLAEAGFSERLKQMPDGLDTLLYKDFEETGIEVSGGEAQKIALARALYKDAPFIILDEPTAALDPIAEYEIYSRFNKIVKNKTVIYISHRLSSCRFCDDIAVFHEGRLIQRGSHEQLLKNKNGKYFELWHSQAQYYQ